MSYEKYGFWIIIILVGVYLLTKIFDWFVKQKQLKFSDTKSEFMSDLFKLQIKWSKRGEIDNAVGIGKLIDAFNLEEEKPATEYGKDVLKKLDNE